ncbi:retrovirus-related Pol polyprotein from transposon RE1 [Gossypium raimondii]|nr:retrovirus-related Pol polyprotein from transposon RE1 [Gossypium raimondii]
MGTTDANISSVMSSLMSFPSIHNQLTIKLTASNYLLWKTQFTPIFHGNQLYCHVDGTASPTKEVNGAPNPAYQAWYIKDQLVLTWIFGSLSEPVLSQVVGSTTAIDAWTKLQTTYASGSRVQIRSLKNSLHSLSRDTDSIVTYMDRAKRIYDQLLALNQPISEDDLVDHILRGLGPEYRPFTRNIEARLVSVKFDDLYGLLLSKESQLQS